MATQAEIKQRYAEWQEHCKRIQSLTDLSSFSHETAVQKEKRIRRLSASTISRTSYNSVTR